MTAEKFLYKLLYLYVNAELSEPVGYALKVTLHSINLVDPYTFYSMIFFEEPKLIKELGSCRESLRSKADEDSISKVIIRHKKKIFDCLSTKKLSSHPSRQFINSSEEKMLNETLNETLSSTKMFEICKSLLFTKGIEGIDHQWINNHSITITYYLSQVKEIIDEFFPLHQADQASQGGQHSQELNDCIRQFIDSMETIVNKYKTSADDHRERKENNTIEICYRLFYPEKSIYYSSLLSTNFIPKDLMKIIVSYLSSNFQEVEEFLLDL
jgi:hypothetical protein